MDGLMRGDNSGGGAGGEESRWLLENAPPGAFSRERAVRLTPAVVRSSWTGCVNFCRSQVKRTAAVFHRSQQQKLMWTNRVRSCQPWKHAIVIGRMRVWNVYTFMPVSKHLAAASCQADGRASVAGARDNVRRGADAACLCGGQ
jgi:hypothetical protein